MFLSFSITHAQTVVQMVKRNGVYYVGGKVDGIPMDFIFDTGASEVSISLIEASFLVKQGKLSKGDFVGYNSYADANGGVSIGMKIILRQFEVGGVILKDVEAGVVQNLDAPLLLGGTVLNRLGRFTIDPANSTLTLYGPTNGQASTGQSSADDIPSYYSKLPEAKGTVTVLTNSPILATPMTGSRVVGTAQNNTVTILKKGDGVYYYVSSGSVTGYLWAGWIKQN